VAGPQGAPASGQVAGPDPFTASVTVTVTLQVQFPPGHTGTRTSTLRHSTAAASH